MSADKRPATALHRVIEKVVSISGFGVPSNPQPQPIESLTDDKTNKISRITSSTIHSKFSKLIRSNNKSRNFEKKLINDIYSWSDTIPNQECSQIIKDFNQIFTLQSLTNLELNEKLEKIKISLNSVNEREKKQKQLLNNKFKTEKILKDNQTRYGPKASSTTLTNEKLENIECSLQVIEQQFLRSISNDLKESLIDYIIMLNKTSRKLQDFSDDLIQHLNNLEESNANGGSMIENEIARISPNKYSRYATNGNNNGLKRKIPNFYDDEHHQQSQSKDSEPIKLKNYDLPTPQSTCAECKKTPCIHTYQNQPDSGIQPLRPQPPQPLPSQPLMGSTITKSNSQSREHFGFHDNPTNIHEPIRAPSMYSDHWN
ncbi:uncharacterized protein KGF55_004701 [Candida pseudojiufengensis]|uniref:uncharacterized protein n=1 Tax=Candida pseudojiufengensis TaxID=497109 RepID=UPI002224E3AD|nr:uncharacterized protein KGF55_004701 [Candida pseudojiufengensis]KAI5960409.1 hypothetical protein KGF55_004701 [Candida pseudojiufengensis]